MRQSSVENVLLFFDPSKSHGWTVSMRDYRRIYSSVRISTGIPGKLMENCTDKPARQLSDNTNDVASASTQKG